ncbi:MAG: DNA primase [Candidatus Contendobacter odensis]|uniref:DNA primase n=1 Tax=Candidatus Contendibacter odensensis TaxID=1400860 RepID=A0A2G6PDQ8_9GAMM|nr:MAG: DNA primase [Candidatus Contendobacter odensis]
MSGRIPQEFLDRLLTQVDLIEIVDARVPLRRAGHEFVACCPFHAEKTPSFTVSPRKQFYHCFGCGAHGNAIGFLMAFERLDFLDAVEDLARLANLDIPREGGHATDSSRALLPWLMQADRFFRQQLRQNPSRQRAIDYLQQRGLSGQTAKTFNIGYAPPGRENLSRVLRAMGAKTDDIIAAGLAGRNEHGQLRDRFRNRIMFPIHDRRGRVIAFGGRVLDQEAKPKYLNSPETPLFHKGATLYGLYEARSGSQHLQRLVIVEGYMDVITLAQHGIHNAVATLGTATTTEHIEQLFRVVDDLVFCFDGDRAGRVAGWRALEVALPLLRDGKQISFLFLPEGDDPDTLVQREGRTVFEQRLVQATSLADYLFAELRTQTDINTLAGRARLATLARPLLEKLPEGNFRDLMEERLRQEAQLTITRLRPPTLSPAKVANRSDRNLQLTRTPLRKAMALLLYRPELAQHVSQDDPVFYNTTNAGIKLLASLINYLHANPALTTATLLERYRNTQEGAILARLAQWQPEEPETYHFEAEFTDILIYLRQHNDQREQLPDMLLRRVTPRALSAEERKFLRNLCAPKNH